jgi:hypothetical protein
VQGTRPASGCAILHAIIARDFEEETVAKPVPEDRKDPAWPQLPDGEHPVTELTTAVQGSLSPFGEIEFPLEEVPYVHPVTRVNR